MQVILLERVEKLGQMGDEVKVKDGFARNFLLPEKKALRATKANREYFITQKAQLEANNLDRRKDAEAVAVKRSSGRSLLDDAAKEAVKGWTFVPATQGGVAIPGWVEVPLVFKLQ